MRYYIRSKSTKTSFSQGIRQAVIILMLTLVIMPSLSSCSLSSVFEFQNKKNTVSGTVELSDRISEEAQKGEEEVLLYVKDVSETEIKNIRENMGLFWGSPTEYVILKALPEDNTLKVKFYIEKSNNYYVVNKYINDTPIPENNHEGKAIFKSMKKMIDKNIKSNMSDYEKELAIHDWLVDKVSYDSGIDAASTENGSYGSLVNKKTMCRGYAEAVKLISECIGLETRVVVGTAINQDGDAVGHAWNMINLDDKWYHLDVTFDDSAGDDIKGIHHYYFNLSDIDIMKNHSWDDDYFPVCDNDSYMYYKKNSLYYANYNDFKKGVTEAIDYDKSEFIEVLLNKDSIRDNELRFVFNNPSVKSIKWTSSGSNPVVVCISPDYY